MELKNLNKNQSFGSDKKQALRYTFLNNLINELKERELPSEIIIAINKEIEELNAFSGSDKKLLKQARKAKSTLLKLIEEELGLVLKYHYQNSWMAYGMLAGVLFSTIFSQLGFANTWNSLGMGISMGLIFGMLAGKNRDEKAFKEGKQLNL